ncbi:MAG: glycine cleavage system protein H [Ignavibacteria bacterium]|nr:glycine cleavage system protein H [Ignavibacteria bacterium]
MTVLLVILTALVFILFNWILQNRRHADRHVPIPPVVPDDVDVALNHIWVQKREGDRLRVGVDWLLSQVSGTPDALHLPTRNQVISDREPIVRLRFGRKMLALASPVAGSVVSVNKRALNNPRLLIEDPYGRGWLLKIKRDPERDRSRSYFVSRPMQWLAKQAESVARFFAAAGSSHEIATAQDGGILMEGLIWEYDSAVRKEFMTRFAALPEE